ncbi:MAG: serine/threonine-protein kinase [Myxococcota bacterium]
MNHLRSKRPSYESLEFEVEPTVVTRSKRPSYESLEFEVGPTVVQPAFSPGSFVAGRFCIERELGKGAMGTVYEATDLESDERIALKVLIQARGVDEEIRARFRRESEILSQINHPGIVRVFAFGHQDEDPWIAMELLEGETLGERIERQGPFELQDLLPIVHSTCSALAAAHAQHIVHRDLKPDNIFLEKGDSSRVKLLDFGLSYELNTKRLTHTGIILGTPRYMAPELCRSARSADSRTDVFSMGVIVYEALAGESPYQASDHGQLLGAILSGAQKPIREVRPDVPQSISDVLDRAMSRIPEQRHQTASEFCESFAVALQIADPDFYPANVSRDTIRNETTRRVEKSYFGSSAATTPRRETKSRKTAQEGSKRSVSGRRFALRNLIPVLVLLGGIVVAAIGAIMMFLQSR